MLAPMAGVSVADERPSVTVDGVTIYDGDLISSNATNPDGTPTYESLDIYIAKVVSDTETYKRLILNPQVFDSYGHLNWGDVKEVDQSVMDSFTTSDLVRQDGTDEVYSLVADDDTGTKHWVNLTAEQFVDEAGADPDSIYTVNSTDIGNYTTGAAYTDVQSFIDRTPPAEAVGTGLTVALASDTPAAASYVRDSTAAAVHAQAVADFVKINFTAASDGDVKVTNLKLTRSGLSADTDLSAIYLYDGDTMIAEHTSFSSKVITFNNAAGLFTVTAGTTKSIAVKADIAAGTSTVSSIILGINSASDVTTDGASVNGTFPINGNQMAVGVVSDLGYINVTSTTTFPATINPGVTDEELWRFTLTANDQDMLVEKIKLTVVGTVSTADLANFKLEQGGVQIGSTVEAMNDSKEVVFDLSGDPYKITSGQSKVIVVKGDVVSGSSRAFKLTLRKVNDLIVKDDGYGVYVAPLSAGAAFSLIDPDPTGDGTNINSGTLTVAVASDSPTGNIASAATGVSLAKFTYKATGEDVKVSYVRVTVDEEDGDKELRNGKLYWDGVQVGNTDTVVADGAVVAGAANDTNANTFSMSQVVPAGETVTLEYKADIIDNATGNGLAADQTIVVHLDAGTTDAIGQSSLANVATAAATAKTLTVATGALSVAKNTSLHDYSSTNATGVKGATNVKVGSFSLTAGAGESVTVTQLVIGDLSGGSDFGDNFQNLKLMNGTTELSTTKGTLDGVAGEDYTFNLSPPVSIAAGAQYVVDVYADILSGAAGFTTAAGVVGLEFVSASATGDDTSTDATGSLSATSLQKLYIASAGTITVVADAATPAAGQLVMGETDVEITKLKFTAGTSEDVNISRIKITDSTGDYNSSLSNVKLYDGTTQIGSTVASFSSDVAEFVLTTDWVIPAGTSKVLTVKVSVNAYPNATSGGTVTLAISGTGDIDSIGAASGAGVSETVTSATGTAQDIYRTKVTVAKGSSSPSGSAVAGAGATVLEFDVTANSSHDAVVNAVAVQASGSANMTSNGSASLYKSTDTTNALATETYKRIIFDDNDGADGGNEYTFQENGNTSDACSGIPRGATVRIYDADGGGGSGAYLAGTFEVATIDSVTGSDCTITFTTAPTTDLDDDDILYYRPMQPGTGKVYFGAQQNPTRGDTAAGLITNGDVTITFASGDTDGFAVGDTVIFKGYTAAGAETTSDAATISAIDATTITVSAVSGLSAAIDVDYLSGSATNAIAKGHNSAAIAYTSNAGNNVEETVSAGTTKTFVVKGDTTGATTNDNLRVDIAAVGDLNWDDTVNYGVTTDTKNLPVLGGTLTY